MKEVCSMRYEFAHGKKPRGKGAWAFEFYRTNMLNETPEIWFAPGVQSFTDAKRSALREARERGAVDVQVAS